MIDFKNIIPFEGYSFKNSVLALKGNLELEHWQETIVLNPNILKNAKQLQILSSSLASQGFLQEAEVAASLALKRSKKSKYPAMLNLAVIYGQQGRSGLQKEILDSIPRHVKTRAVIYANFLVGNEKEDEAIPFFEQAIREEPDFYLPYCRLISCLGFSETAVFWAQLARHNFPKDPEVAFCFAYVNLVQQNYFEIVSELNTFDGYNLEKDSRIVGCRTNKGQFLEDAKTIQFIAKTICEKKTTELGNCYELISSYTNGSKCELVKPLLELTVQSGDISLSRCALDLLCDDCTKRFNIGFMLFKTAKIGGELKLAESFGNDAFSDSSNKVNPIFAIEFASFLDDIGNAERALKILKPYFPREELHITTRARLFWDGFFYAGNIGSWLFSYTLLDKFMNLDLVELAEFSGVSSEGAKVDLGDFALFIELAPLNKLYILIALRRFSEFSIEFEQYKQASSAFLAVNRVSEKILYSHKEVEFTKNSL